MKSFGALYSLGLVTLLCLTSCGGAFSNVPPPLSTQQLVAHEGSVTVALVHTDEDKADDEMSGVRPLCSAVWVDKTHILTAYHCAVGIQEELQAKQDEKEKNAPDCEGLAKLLGLCDEGDAEHKVIEMRGLPVHYVQWKEADEPGKEPTAQHLSHVVGWDEAHDLALLEAAGHAVPEHEFAKVNAGVPAMGERIHVCGHPKGLYWTFLEGTVAGYRQSLPHLSDKKDKVKREGPYLQLEVPIYYGNSGGGAFNDAGELIGIADFMLRVPSEGFFVAGESIKAFLVDQEVLPGKVKVKKEEVKPVVAPVINVTVVAPPPVVPETPPAEATPPATKADVIPAPPLVIPQIHVPTFTLPPMPPLGVTPKP